MSNFLQPQTPIKYALLSPEKRQESRLRFVGKTEFDPTLRFIQCIPQHNAMLSYRNHLGFKYISFRLYT
jgi:hypothetical protein